MADVILLDGGMGQELVHRSGEEPTPLWATRVMLDHPGMVQAIHADYFAAGATLATVNSYAIHRDRLVGHGVEDLFESLLARALDEARAARAAHGSGRIAGSLGPLAASYRPELHPPHDRAVALYAEVARLLAPGVDLLLCETVASLAHARAVLEGALSTGLPVWLSATVDDEDGRRLRSGEPVSEFAALARDGAAAVLANCSAPEAMPAALEALAAADLPFGAYANGFHEITKDFLRDSPTVSSLGARTDLSPEGYARSVLGWVEQGAGIVGGCCEIGPAHIAELARQLRAAGHRIV
ncbi:homocysteine S-methyltransferase family protein [Frigidibacter sp. ROC022]|uniref:homocysteine S-methyltransferase family protein n=1 Tax=Frigidibacter sp. ROC022 TaxID=2971796 RepID=UPI00215B71E2|nr:homocysteine S-methyltransferase family protein [Frigidibacter sp. ROC022]MCR8724976.1 homocysteine S-methyltransferase family protein [Frigidibacter sp. ROC022]